MIKSETSLNSGVSVRSFPYLGRSRKTNTVVLFTAPREGFVVSPSDNKELGIWQNDWREESFVPFIVGQTVTLTQI